MICIFDWLICKMRIYVKVNKINIAFYRFKHVSNIQWIDCQGVVSIATYLNMYILISIYRKCLYTRSHKITFRSMEITKKGEFHSFH